MSAKSITVNGKSHNIDVDEQTPILWVLRDILGLTGTKYGCGLGLCGVCTVQLDGEPIGSCNTPVMAAFGKKITTIEGLSPNGSHPLQLAWIDEQVSQCGYCQPGQLMSAAALLAKNPKPSDADIDEAMSYIICRCGTYQRIRCAIKRVANQQGGAK